MNDEPGGSAWTRSFDSVVMDRRSVRGFVPERRVPEPLLMELLRLAQRAPSNCNTQPWRVFIASGDALTRLRAAWLHAIETGLPSVSLRRFEHEYRVHQVECATRLYEKMGVRRDDTSARHAAFLRNYACFDAPHAAILAMDAGFDVGAALDVGAYLQTFLLALESRGIASCAQASLANFPDVTRQVLGIPESLRILCGVSFGYEDLAVPANSVRQGRSDVPDNVTFIE